MEEWEPSDPGGLEMIEERVCEDVGPREENTELEISLHALTRSMNPKTMRLLGKIGNQQVVILIDSGSTHNFLDLAIIRRAQLKTKKGEYIVKPRMKATQEGLN